MSNFVCAKCGVVCVDSVRGYVSGCEHYPPDVKPFWHQFRKIGDPREVWCEVLDEDLHMIEETKAHNA